MVSEEKKKDVQVVEIVVYLYLSSGGWSKGLLCIKRQNCQRCILREILLEMWEQKLWLKTCQGLDGSEGIEMVL